MNQDGAHPNKAMDLAYREDYWDDSTQKAEFNRFLKKIFNLDLSLWDEKGYWDRKFRPFSYFDGDKMVSNVCVYSMNMTVESRPCRVAQISSVATDPNYQRRGLSRDLMLKAMDWAREAHDFFFLFADEEAIPFYRKCGFRPVDEYKARLAVSGRRAVPGAEKLDLKNGRHLGLISDIAANRLPVSELLGVTNRRLFMFWCFYFLKDNIYYVSDLDLLVLYERREEVVTVSDIVGKNIPAFTDIYPYIASENDRAVEFLFMPDRLKLHHPDWVKVTENGTHLSGDFPLETGKFIFPLTAHA